MVRKKYTEEHIIAVLKESEAGAKIGDLCRKYGMSDATFYNWKAKYAGLTVSELKRLQAPWKTRTAVSSRLWPSRPSITGRSRSCSQKTSKAQGQTSGGVVCQGESWAE